MLREVRLDLGDPGPGPILQPGVVEVVLDLMETAFAHGSKYRSAIRRRHGPIGSTCRTFGPISSTPMAGVLLVNPRAGNERPNGEELAGEAAKRGITAHILKPGEDAAEVARTPDADTLG